MAAFVKGDGALPAGVGLPSTGALGGAPMQHNYKRAVIRPPPRCFTVEVLPPTKFGNGYCYGMRILPLTLDALDDGSSKSSRSSRSGGSTAEYDVWRRWEDCLWFQELLETEYSLMARTKRQGLAKGKGVKKDGVYIHSDRASSWESLPPGPEASSIAKDVHAVIPKLTKKGTLFRASQSTIEQRGREFKAMITAMFQEDVPTLIKELRDERVIRDFFAYWRRDKDHERKMSAGSGLSSNNSSRLSIGSNAFSMYFSASNISLQLPNAYDMPPSPPLSSATSSFRTRGSTLAENPARESLRPHPLSTTVVTASHSPASAPAGMSFTMTDQGAIAPTSSSEDGHYSISSDGHESRSAPLRPTSARWSRDSGNFLPSQEPGNDEFPIVLMPEGQTWKDPIVPDHQPTRGLQALPEDQVLSVPDMSNLNISGDEAADAFASRPPIRRPRNNSCPIPGSRNGLIFMTPPQAPVASDKEDEISILEGFQQTDANSVVSQPLHGSDRSSNATPKTPNTNSNSSRHSSMALSSFSFGLSRRSSRTSIGSQTSVAPSPSLSPTRDSCIDIDRALSRSSVSLNCDDVPVTTRSGRPRHGSRASISTMNSIISNSSVDAILPRSMFPTSSSRGGLRRSLSAGSRRSTDTHPTLSIRTEETWYEEQEDLIDAYFYDPGLHSSPVSPEPRTPTDHPESIDPPDTPGRECTSILVATELSTPQHFPKPFQHRPPGQFHLPWTHIDPSSEPSPPPSIVSPTSPNSGSLTVKAVMQDSIIVLRVTYFTTLEQLRQRIQEKFAAQEDVQLTDYFTIGYLAAMAPDPVKSGQHRPRSSSTSSVGTPIPNRMRYISSEEVWQEMISSCTGKVTLRIFDRF